MEQHFELTDPEFEQRIKDCKLGPIPFTHIVHLRLAWIHVFTYGEAAAIENIFKQLKAYMAFVGAKDNFNLTLTIAAIKAVNHFIHKSASTTFKEYIVEFPELVDNFKGLIGTHYSTDVFKAEMAKSSFLQPDLIPFN